MKLFTLPGGQSLGYEVGGTMEYFHKDRIGSVLALSTDGGGKDAWSAWEPAGTTPPSAASPKPTPR